MIGALKDVPAAVAGALMAVLCWPTTLAAAPGAGCAAVNSGLLNANVSSAGPVTRQIFLEQGDIVSFSARSASVALVDGAGAPAALIGGSATAATLKAPVATTYTFQFAASGNGGSVSASCTSGATDAANAAFLARRKAMLTERDPDRLRIDRAPTPITGAEKPLSSVISVDENGKPKDVGFSVSLSEIQAASKGGKVADPGIVDFWLEGRMQNYASTSLSSRSSDGNIGVLYLGTRSMIGPDIMIGALAQLDRGVESSAYSAPEMAAKGWMFGPYMSMRLGSGVVFDGRAAWGETQSDIASTDIDNGHAERRLVRVKITVPR